MKRKTDVQSKHKNAASLSALKRLLRYVGRCKGWLLGGTLLSALAVLSQLVVPILFGSAVDCILGPQDIQWPVLLRLLGTILALVVLSALFTWVMTVCFNRLAYGIVRDIRSDAMEQIQRLPLSYLDAHPTGDIMQRVIADTDQVADGLLMGFSQFFAGVVTIVFTLVFMLTRSGLITLLVLLLTPLSFVVARFIAKRSYTLFRRQTETRGALTGLIHEMITGQKVVQAFGYEDKASARFERINTQLKKDSQGAVFFSSLTNPSTRAVNNLIYACVALCGALQILAGAPLTVGGLTVLLSYANQYMKPFNDISSVITELQNSLACASRVFELIDTKPEEPSPAQALPPVEGRVELKDVSFSYNPGQKLIEHFSLQAKPAQMIAIVGPTGCGKTTFINLLMRFYDVNSGSICVENTDIRSVSRASLRHSYGMVLQDTWLTEGTVRQNIAFARPDATEEEIIRAAREAHSWEFIRRLPQGLDTPLREDSLSQGQKQLLCITRVMLCRPPMLILDEATSSIDTRTEIQIQQAFARLMEGRTSFIVAHRLSTIRDADLILVMRDGAIIEQGSHETLLQQKGFYASLYQSQFVLSE